MLRTDGLSVSFGGIRAVDDVAIDVHPGEALGIIGPNGAGKTTLFDMVSGFLRPDGGRVWLDGRDITSLNAAARAGPRARPVVPGRPAVPEPHRRRGRRRRLRAVRRRPATRSPPRSTSRTPTTRSAGSTARVDELLELLGLDRYRSTFVHELSTGTRRIVDLACLLAHRPTVILLDEPSSGIAQRETEALGPLLRRIRDATGAALVVIEHDMPLLRSVVDRLVAMDQGAVIADGPTADVLQDPLVVASYLGTTDAAIERSTTTGGATTR